LDYKLNKVASVLGSFKLASLQGVFSYPPDLQDDSTPLKGRMPRSEELRADAHVTTVHAMIYSRPEMIFLAGASEVRDDTGIGADVT